MEFQLKICARKVRVVQEDAYVKCCSFRSTNFKQQEVASNFSPIRAWRELSREKIFNSLTDWKNFIPLLDSKSWSKIIVRFKKKT